MRDKIYVNDHKKTIEIGAFQEERFIQQDVVFHVEIELNPQRTDLDIVDNILSYDVIVDAINDTLTAKRYNLLETMAEDIATRILTHSQVFNVLVSIEKLGRIDGKLGIKILRDKKSSKPADIEFTNQMNAIFVDALDDDIVIKEKNIVIPIYFEFPVNDETSRRVYALQNDALAWKLSKTLKLPVVDTKVESLSLISRQIPFVRALGKQVFDQMPELNDFSKDGLIQWHKEQLSLTFLQDFTKVK